MGKCPGQSVALVALTISLFEITPAAAANASKLAAQARRCCRRHGGEAQTRVPAQSIIDSFGIFYHDKGIVRGVDLTSSFAYQSANPPFVFGN